MSGHASPSMTTAATFAGRATLGIAAIASLSCAFAMRTEDSDAAQKPNGISATKTAAAAMASRLAMSRSTDAASTVYSRNVGTKNGNTLATSAISTNGKGIWLFVRSDQSTRAKAVVAPMSAARLGCQRFGVSEPATAPGDGVAGATEYDSQTR